MRYDIFRNRTTGEIKAQLEGVSDTFPGVGWEAIGIVASASDEASALRKWLRTKPKSASAT